MICVTGLDLLQSSGEYPCAVCGTEVGNNSIYCNDCKLWMHKKCSGVQHRRQIFIVGCRVHGKCRPIDDRLQSEVQVGPYKLEVVASFCYLGDMLSADGDCEITVTSCVKNSLEEVQEATTNSHIPSTILQDPRQCIQLLCAERHAPC